MKIEYRLHPNCSEWDDEVSADDDYDYQLWKEIQDEKQKKEAEEAIRNRKWDE